MHRFVHRPSPALAVALLALFVALGGTGYAASHSQPGTVSAQAAKGGSRGPRGPAGPPGPRGPKGDTGAPAVKFWAKISNGNVGPTTVLASSGGITVQRDASGFANVRFPTDVSQCATEITHVGGPAGVTIRNSSASSGATVSVVMEQGAGGTVLTRTDAFDIAVFC